MAQDETRKNRGNDAIGRFVSAVESSPEFCQTLRNGSPAEIAAALKEYEIDLAAPQRDQFVNACVALAAVEGWEPLNELRKSLLMPPGAGVMG